MVEAQKEKPKIGSDWNMSSEHYAQVDDIPVEVVMINGSVVLVEIQDQEWLDEQVRRARKHQREFQDMENTLEVYPHVKEGKDGIEPSDTRMFFSVEEFYQHCE